MLNFPENALKVLSRLNAAGYDSYIVGGAVRDALLGQPVYDYDITTAAKTEDIKRVFCDCTVITTGERHGTETVVFEGKNYEITTFRSDGEYKDNRHPAAVEFLSDVNGDLNRRDFTVNAMAYSPKSGLIDLFGGETDLKNSVIRAVGDPEKRFKEDALRILRAVRFSSKLGFKIEEKTFAAMLKCKSDLSKLSVERIYSELCGILQGKFAASAIRTCREVVFEVLPELAPEYNFDQKSLSHDLDVFEHTLKVVENAAGASLQVLWAALLHDSGKPHTYVFGTDGFGHFPGHWEVSEKIAKSILTRLKAPKKLIERVCALCLWHDDFFYGGKPQIKRLMARYGQDYFSDLVVLRYADLYAHSPHGVNKYKGSTKATHNQFDEIVKNSECYLLSQLDLRGDDLSIFTTDGKRIGELLNIALNAVIDEKVENQKSKLIEYLSNGNE